MLRMSNQRTGHKGISMSIIQGDALKVLKTLEEKSIDCVITSPPYWGLRDYGTARWEGGDKKCKHIVGEIRTGLGMSVLGAKYRGGGHKASKSKPLTAKNVCPKCDAKRIDAQLGLEETPEEYVEKMVEVFREVRQVLKKEGTCWLNLGDSYAGSGKGGSEYKDKKTNWKQGTNIGSHTKGIGAYRDTVVKPKDLVGIPWRVALALQADGWYLRQDIIWAKPNPMPESVTDRCTKSHEYIFLLTKSPKYYFDNEAIKEEAIYKEEKRAGLGRIHYRGKREGQKGTGQENFVSIKDKRNKRSVWTITTKPFKEAHFATFPEDLIVPMIKAGCPKGGVVLDPFMGAGTTAIVAEKLGRKWSGIELNPEYIKLAERRIKELPRALFT